LTAGALLSTTSEGGDGHGALPGAGACDSADHRPISLPRDDGPHDGTIEWWWWYGQVSADGRRFAFMLFFASKPAANYQYTEFTLTDLETGAFHYDRQPFIAGLPWSTRPGVALRGDHASATAANGHDTLRFAVDGYELELELKAVKPAVVEFGDGFTTFYCNSFYNYSRPRMRAVGTLTRQGKAARVTGSSNFTHNWGFAPGFETLRYNHFTFELDDGRDVHVARLRAGRSDSDGAAFYAGSISDAQGRVTALHRGDFALRETRYWQRDKTCKYPVEWDVTVQGRHLHVRPSVVRSELRATQWPAMFALWPEWPAYWTGQTQISGSAIGHGWMEHAGYCTA
jgi:predicted secreted hydrolase